MDREEVNGAFFSPWAMGCSHGEKGDMFKWDVWGFGKIWGFHLENGYLMVYIYVYICIWGIQRGSVEIISWDIFNQFDIICLCV